MRIQAAVGISAVVVIVKVTLTTALIGLTMWTAISRRCWPAGHWHVELGNLAAWLSALGSFTAAVIALSIANRNRNDSRRASDEAHMAQARLVRVSFEGLIAERGFAVEVENWGSLSILDVALIDASFVSSFRPSESPPRPVLTSPEAPIPILVPKSREALAQPRFVVDFQNGDSSMLSRDESIGYDPVSSTHNRVSATIEFTDAHGTHWQQSTEGTPMRLRSRSAETLHPAR